MFTRRGLTALYAATAIAVLSRCTSVGDAANLPAPGKQTPTMPEELNLEIHYATSGPHLSTIAYPTCRTWSADSKCLFIESSRPRPNGTKAHENERQLLKIDIETGEAVHLTTLEVEETEKYGAAHLRASSQYHCDYAPEADVMVYYDMTGHNMYLLDVATGKSNRILHEREGTIGDPPAITPDGKRVVYYVLYPSVANRFLSRLTSVIFALDVDPNTLEAVGEPKVITTYPGRIVEGRPHGVIVNHCQVNSKDHDHYCYAHEFGGTRTDGSLVLTRCWENRNGIDRPLDRPLNLEGQTHEVIGPLGTSLYFVESWHVSAVDFATYRKRQICEDSALRPSHITVSPDEKWIAADMWGGSEPLDDGLFHSGILLIEAAIGKMEVLCRFPRGRGHPRHPHPNFSPDGTKIAFVVADGPKNSQVAYVDISDVIENWGRGDKTRD